MKVHRGGGRLFVQIGPLRFLEPQNIEQRVPPVEVLR